MKRDDPTHLARPAARACSVQRPEVRYMPFDQWTRLPGFSANRDHEARIKVARVAQRFQKLLPTHMTVSVARFPDGRLIKIDGHTRAEAWRLGMMERPDEMAVSVIDVPDLATATAYYDTIDSPDAKKTGQDTIYSALRANGFAPVSGLIRKCQFGEALRIAAKRGNRHYTKRHQVIDLATELALLDGIYPERTDFPTPVTAAALLSLRRDGAPALEFWRQYLNAEDDSTPAVQVRAFINKAVWGTAARNDEVTGLCLVIYEAWVRNPLGAFDHEAVLAGYDGQTYLKNFKRSLVSAA